MSSNTSLPAKGSDVTVYITRVHLQPLCVLVEFWGKVGHGNITDYEGLTKDIQSPGAIFKDLEGNPGDQCLTQIDGTWYRSRIVSRNGSKYSVYLLDKGVTYTTTSATLAWGKKEHFQSPPEVEHCVLANVLPLSESGWSPVALEFLRSLCGKSVAAQVQDVLEQQRIFLLHIPCISKQMFQMGFAKKLSSVAFQDFVFTSFKSHNKADSSSNVQQVLLTSSCQLRNEDLFMYPELSRGTVEIVIVKEVINPQRIFCQLKVFSQELKKLSEKITQNYEGRVSSCIVNPDMIGFPCAARGNDGKWYRCVLQQVFSENKAVEVISVDYGTKQIVQVENVRPLATEFFRMPVVTYMCSLHGIIDKGLGWNTSQIDFLKSLLLNRTLTAKFEYQSIYERVYFVTLYGDDNTNMNTLFGSKERCLLEHDKRLGDYAIQSTTYNHRLSSPKERISTFPHTVTEKGENTVDKSPSEELALNSSHLAVVQHISTPSEFWIQTKKYQKELEELSERMNHIYQDTVKLHVKNPTPGLYCAAQAGNGEFYRATVTEVGETQVTVFFVDYGNKEVVDMCKIRILPPELKTLPQLALKCSLDGVMPKNEKWSQNALDFFIQAVAEKEVNVHVKAKYSDCYSVQLTDDKAHCKQNVNAQVCHYILSERVESQRPPAVEGFMKAAFKSPPHVAYERLPGVHNNNGISFQSASGPISIEKKVPPFKEYKFPLGSFFDVIVSHIESPNDFWCQLVQNAECLQLLMHDLQAYYANSEYEPNVETACVAQHPNNGKWYRALVIQKHETPLVDVLFVDYGHTVTVSLYDLRRICPNFLNLHGQAFRCSLLNPFNTTLAINGWNEELMARFERFVQTTASNFIPLKCTIRAIMYSEQMIVYNIVDLETPFESISTCITNMLTRGLPKKATEQNLHLDTYYHSTHNVKTGKEEHVTVTFVKNINHFYCQLDKNDDVIQNLRMKVNSLCQQLEKVKPPAVFGTLCFARYTDGEWYRAQIVATNPAVMVHFVDYGDTIEVHTSDLLPVPKEAHDIMSVPVQAVLCGLSDLPTNVPCEVNKWFETEATECQFQALIVARQPDGKLLVELYQESTQINAKVRKEFHIELQTNENVLRQDWKDVSTSQIKNTSTSFPNQMTTSGNNKQAQKNNFSDSKHVQERNIAEKSTDVHLKSAQKSLSHCKNGRIRQKFELYKPPHQRQPCVTMPTNSFMQGKETKQGKDDPQPETKLADSQTPETKNQTENYSEKLPTLADLPSKNITPGMSVDVYVSHCNNPLSFYVQCVNEEAEVVSLVEKLNDPESTAEDKNIKSVLPGDLIQAEFTDDLSWYRAVVKEICGDSVALVEFVDFGNTSMTPVFKMGRLPKSFVQLPVYSTHCMLSNAVLGEPSLLNPDIVSAFKEDIGCCGERVFQCKFIRQVGSMWVVSLKVGGVDIVCKVPNEEDSEVVTKKQVNEHLAQITDVRHEGDDMEKSPANLSFTRYPDQEEIPEGKQLNSYITTINDDLTMWCQPTDSQELDKISSDISEIGNSADKLINPEVLVPGSPCAALFSDDQLWYRAEIVNKCGDELSVRFVDYGNESQVNIKDVKEIPLLLVQIPPQVFLCELEGFDTSCGSWNSGAAEELSTLTSDQTIQLTVTNVTRCNGKMKCLVQMSCEGQIINEVMKAWWTCSKTTDMPDLFNLAASFEPLVQPGFTTSAQEDPPNYPELQHVFSTDISQSNSEEQSADKITDASMTNEVLKLTHEKHGQYSEYSIQNVSFDKPAKEEQDFTEKENTLAATVIFPKDILTCDDEVDDTFCSVDDKDGQDALSLSCNLIMATGEEADDETTSVVHENAQEDCPLKENVIEAIAELESKTSDKENTSTYSLNNEPFVDADNIKHNEVAVSMGNSGTCSAAQMVPRNAVPQKTMDSVLDFSKRAKLRPFSVDVTVQLQEISVEQNSKDGDEITEEELHRKIPSHAKIKCISDEDASAYEEESLPGIVIRITDVAQQLKVPASSASTSDEDKLTEDDSLPLYDEKLYDDADPQIDSDLNKVDELTSLVEEISLTDIRQDSEDAETLTEDCDERSPTPPQNKGPDESTLTEQTSAAEDSFEAQLSKITHLSLVIKDTRDDLLAEDQCEE
nr:tudor domain-containing 6 isoform X1 [Nothobranchius furzeri]